MGVMASQELWLPPAPTTILDIGDDLLREIFLLLPSLPSLVRAALACPAFLQAVRSCPVFRRRFQSLHPPQILGFFIDPLRTAIPTFTPLRRRSDPDLAALVRAADFFLTRLPEDNDDFRSGWQLESCHDGYVVLVNYTTKEIAAYNPLTQALDIFPMPPQETLWGSEFHIVVSKEDQGVFRMVGVQMPGRFPALMAVFSLATKEWKISPWVEPPQAEDDAAPPMPPQPEGDGDGDGDGHDTITFSPGTRLNGLVYWQHTQQAYALLLDTVTLQFSRVDLPSFLVDSSRFELGHTKDGELCIVVTDNSEGEIGSLAVWIWRADDDGVRKWIFAKLFPLIMFVTGDASVSVEAVIDGFVYLYANYAEQHVSVLSLCLETGKLNKLLDDTYISPGHPYIMVWPPSLVCNKEDSQSKDTGDSVADVGPVGTEESPSVLDV